MTNYLIFAYSGPADKYGNFVFKDGKVKFVDFVKMLVKHCKCPFVIVYLDCNNAACWQKAAEQWFKKGNSLDFYL